ncbi:MAG: hypothetical protein IPM75_10420 [Candidatus Competibacteraceae bacterium]|nr:hypothetical protein [Candidatus Competibacteraceae bacterium]
MEKPTKRLKSFVKALSASMRPSLQPPNKHKTAEFSQQRIEQHLTKSLKITAATFDARTTRLWNILNAEKMEWHYAFNNLDIGWPH